MKYFKCGKCAAPYKIDPSKFRTAKVDVICPKCGTKNVLSLGPVLAIQQEGKFAQIGLKEGSQVIGRKTEQPNTNTHILIADEFVSRVHAKVIMELREGKVFFFIEDLGSSNGTYNKNKQRLKVGLKYPFMPGDFFIVGLTKISIQINS
jgi:predicted Zn finger-like uncharacterized protein